MHNVNWPKFVEVDGIFSMLTAEWYALFTWFILCGPTSDSISVSSSQHQKLYMEFEAFEEISLLEGCYILSFCRFILVEGHK